MATANPKESEPDLRLILKTLVAIEKGDFSVGLPRNWEGIGGKIANAINNLIDLNRRVAREFGRIGSSVGRKGKLSDRIELKGVSGSWSSIRDSANSLIDDLAHVIAEMTRVSGTVLKGDFSRSVSTQVDGRPLKGDLLLAVKAACSMLDQLGSLTSEVTRVAREVGTEGKLGGQVKLKRVSGTWKDLSSSVNQLAANLSIQVRSISDVATAVTRGNIARKIEVKASGELSRLRDDINEMISTLRETTRKNLEQDWFNTNLTRFTRMLQGERDLLAVAKSIISELAPLVNSQHGVFYVLETFEGNGEPRLGIVSSYAIKNRKNISNGFALGEGLVGQCALEKKRILLTNVPSDYVRITSGLGYGKPLNIIILPILFEGMVKGVIELSSFEPYPMIHQLFLEKLMESIGVVLNTIETNTRTEQLLSQSRSMAEELQEHQAELQQTNEELEEKALLLAEQKSELEFKNAEVEKAKKALEEKASQLALASKYKAEFLSNMSHELRNPLNSLLLLSQQLAENSEKNLTPQQIEFARTIHGSGQDLLALITDILDLSKFESGTVILNLSDVRLSEIRENIERAFRPVADSKMLAFEIRMAGDLPVEIQTDGIRLKQVLKNLLSNAFKFTGKGRVTLAIGTAVNGWSPGNNHLNRARQIISFAVTDTGIGIPPEKQHAIFEAFRQADGSSSRRYGGTGLGLFMSREIACMLGGEITLSSKPGQGSTFTFFVPCCLSPNYEGVREAEPGMDPVHAFRSGGQPARPETSHLPVKPDPEERLRKRGIRQSPVPDDLDDLKPGDRVLLIVEDDVNFAESLLAIARGSGFKGVLAFRGETALSLAGELLPDAITLDIDLPDIDGWTVLDRLKSNAMTRHIPVHIITVDENRTRGLRRGAFNFLIKPASRASLEGALCSIVEYRGRPKRLLVVDGNEAGRNGIVKLIGSADVDIFPAGTGEAALDALVSKRFDCMILDLALPGISGLDVIERIHGNKEIGNLPVLIYTKKDLSPADRGRLDKLSQSIVIKDVRSPERLLDETALFLHLTTSALPEEKREMIEKLYRPEAVLAGKKILIVDDDIRNVFALTSLMERYNVENISAKNGKAAMDTLLKQPGIHAVLMDLMMPEMDGYEAIRSIRKISRFKTLPIIALTAKTMTRDREKCLEAGASDYITKPINTDQLLSMLRVWLHR